VGDSVEVYEKDIRLQGFVFITQMKALLYWSLQVHNVNYTRGMQADYENIAPCVEV
jgi:hypothetical protein